jgi:hypothetical protein
MSTKKKTAVGKAAKAPTAEHLTAQIRSDKAKEASLKHEAAEARRPAVRKHDLAQAASIGKKITSLKHERAERKAKSKAGLALVPGDVSCCAAQALAASLRLALGVTVHEQDMLALYWRTADDPDEGASILDTLRAAREYGLSGIRPAGWLTRQWGQRPAEVGDLAAAGAEALHQAAAGLGLPSGPDVSHFAAFTPAEDRQPDVEIGRRSDLLGTHGLILRLDLPEGPHAVTAALDGTWWSWGEPYSPEDFAGAVIEDAWAVNW